MAGLVFLLLCFAVVMALAMRHAPMWLWATAAVVATYLWQSGLIDGRHDGLELGLLAAVAWVPALVAVLMAIPAVRRMLLVEPAFTIVKRILPKVSDTEQQALDAGTIGFDAELFSGHPDWEKLRAVPADRADAPRKRRSSTGRRKSCAGCSTTGRSASARRRFPRRSGRSSSRNGFLGMLISKAHGGLGFSAQAQSLILGKIASRSPDVGDHRHGAELARSGRADREVRHRRAEASLPAAARARRGGPMLLADRADLRARMPPPCATSARSCAACTRARRRSASSSRGTSATSRWGPKATLVGLAFRLFDPDKLSAARARTSASRWR